MISIITLLLKKWRSVEILYQIIVLQQATYINWCVKKVCAKNWVIKKCCSLLFKLAIILTAVNGTVKKSWTLKFKQHQWIKNISSIKRKEADDKSKKGKQ